MRRRGSGGSPLRCCDAVVALALAAAVHVVMTAVAALHAGRVEGRPTDTPAAAEQPPHGAGKQASGAGQGEQAVGGLLQRGVVRHVLQGQDVTQIGQVVKQLRQAAVIGLEEDCEHQAGEELGLGVDFGAELVGVRVQGGLGGVQGPPSHDDRRFA